MKRLFKTKKRITFLTAVAALAAAAGAYAYFTASGSGTGSAKVAGGPPSLLISQIGAGYDSLIPGSGDPYTQDQCFECSEVTEIGNDVTLANPGAQQLVSVVVALRSWDATAVTGLPITLTINNGISGPITVTQDFNIPAAINPATTPTVYNAVFNLSSLGAYVNQEFVYGISFSPAFDGGAAGGLNVALSSSGGTSPGNDLSVGTDTTPGTIYLDLAASPNDDFPTCMSGGTVGTFSEWTTNGACGYNPSNPGAYGTNAQVVAGSADIPAVEFNVVGGIVTGLSPGGPSQPVDFAITNPGSSNVHLNQVYTTVTSVGSAGISGDELCATSMFQVGGSPVNGIGIVPPGTTIFSPSGTTIKMLDDGNNQDNCENQAVGLTFSTT